jgi:DNA-directed RNA polymerase alpha subunit
MVTITYIESRIHKPGNLYSYLVLEPFDVGHGITVANSLRRCILADLYGCAIKGVRINGLRHEFGYVYGVKEEPLEILMNLKGIIFGRNYSIQPLKSFKSMRSFLSVKGPIIVTASMLQLPKNLIKIFNPQHYICSILTDSELYLELDIETGKGCNIISYDSEIYYKRKKKFFNTKGNTLLIDSLFNPIQSVNYKIKLIHDKLGNLKESLHFEIVSNQTITPYRAILQGTKSLLNLFLPILVTKKFIIMNLEILKNYYSLQRYREYKKKIIRTIFRRIFKNFFIKLTKIKILNNIIENPHVPITFSVTENFKNYFKEILIRILIKLNSLEEKLQQKRIV